MAAVPRRACLPVASTGRHLDPRRASSRRTAATARQAGGGRWAERVCGAALSLSLSLSASTVAPQAAVAIPQTANEDYSYRDFRGQDLSEEAAAAMRTTAVQFAKGRMQGTDFTEANCRGVSFFGAYLKDAIFHDADLSYTNMGQANLTGADLSGARLEGAIFSSAILDKVSNIENSDWSEVLLRPDINDSLCALESAKGVNPVTGVATRDSLFCD